LAYKVILQSTALGDAEGYAQWIKEQSGLTPAERWLRGLEAVIGSLAEMPARFKVIDEQEEFSVELRQVLHHSHRVIYHVNEVTQSVHVLRIYHGARRPLSKGDVPQPRG